MHWLTNDKEQKAKPVYVIGSLLLTLVGCAQMPSGAVSSPVPSSAQAGATTIVAIAPPATPQASLPQFLGLTGLSSCLGTGCQRIRNRLGARFPGLEARPPMLALTDPANMKEDANPSVKAAAEAKAEQDQAPQKVKAITFLASLGCGKCYPDTEMALLAAMDDCNESVRFASVSAIRKAAGGPCRTCCNGSCCSEKIVEKLRKIAYDSDNCGGHLEQSARVRRMARLALCACGSPCPSPESSEPEEGPSVEKPNK
jgi:hypothetical protein